MEQVRREMPFQLLKLFPRINISKKVYKINAGKPGEKFLVFRLNVERLNYELRE